MTSQKARWESTSPEIKARYLEFESAFVATYRIVVSKNFFETGSPSAAKPLRAFLTASGVHDYRGQPQGGVLNSAKAQSRFLRLDMSGDVLEADAEWRFYRTESDAEHRYSVTWPKGFKPLVDEVLFVAGDRAGGIVLLNATANIGAGPAGAILWSKLMATATAKISAAKASRIESDLLVFDDENSEPKWQNSQGFLQDAKLRTALEKYSVARAKKLYEAQGAVLLGEPGKPYDLRYQLLSAEVHVEVKGSTQDLQQILLTENEVIHAHEPIGVDLVIVDKIIRERRPDGEWHLTGGRIRQWKDWKLDKSRLRALKHQYAIDPSCVVDTNFNLGVEPLSGS
jgi:hypothetical protein